MGRDGVWTLVGHHGKLTDWRAFAHWLRSNQFLEPSSSRNPPNTLVLGGAHGAEGENCYCVCVCVCMCRWPCYLHHSSWYSDPQCCDIIKQWRWHPSTRRSPKSFTNCVPRDHSPVIEIQPPRGWESAAFLSLQNYSPADADTNTRSIHVSAHVWSGEDQGWGRLLICSFINTRRCKPTRNCSHSFRIHLVIQLCK